MAEAIPLLTHSGDFYTIDRVAAALARRGARPVRVDTDLYPARYQLTVRFPRQSAAGGRAGGPTRSGGEAEVLLDTGAEVLRLDRAPAIWSRRLWPGRIPAEVDARFRASCERAARAHFLEALGLCRRPFWINALEAGARAESKLLQLDVALALGFRMPETLVTNAPGAVRELWRRTRAGGGDVVTKLLLPLSQTMDASGAFVYTSLLAERDLDEGLEALRLAPQIFQPLIAKAEELRAIVVGRRIFCGAVRFPDAAAAPLDWRIGAPGAGAAAWSVRELSPALAERIHGLMDRLGLVYGALDLIDPGDGGEPVFLELNPAGEWGWLERDLELPIADAIAGALLDGGCGAAGAKR